MKYKKEKKDVRNMLQSQWKVPYPNLLLSCKDSIGWKKASKKTWSSYLKLLILLHWKEGRLQIFRTFQNFLK